jgi:hypothetical protein
MSVAIGWLPMSSYTPVRALAQGRGRVCIVLLKGFADVCVGGDWYGHMNADDDVETMVTHYHSAYLSAKAAGTPSVENLMNQATLPRSLRSLWRGRRSMSDADAKEFVFQAFQ